MKIYIAADHAGFYLKKDLIKYLEIKGYTVEDCGAFEMNEEDDYVEFCAECSRKVIADEGSLGIVIGGSGNGEAIVANKIKGIRAAVYNGGKAEIAKLAKEHNNANVLSLGARFITPEEAKKAITLWLEADFEGGRHQRRIEKISKLEGEA
ncbi:MAG TPA: RpiB/LacA/LacB family sugar-phosphate isomerase [Candidatus Saccharimonadales bacterium]|nr:RpiB/LacA/LacB family sugar-phosphate isomerase [Candidatus Saccharimonadales bacterium]